jgi:hypothetical protein
MVLLLALSALLPLMALQRDAQVVSVRHTEWPQAWDGRELRPLAMSAVEQRFAARFPGAIARFTDGQRVVLLRSVQQPTRMLHPAADCFRGLGYAAERARLERDADQRLWRCFEARRGSDPTLRVCEHIEAHDGGSFTDASSWFWAAALGQSQGPWRAVTVVEEM